MDLGKAKLRRNGTNYLQHALHPEHGMVWTDGRNIYQAPVHLYKDQVENAASTKLGEFEQVQSVHWSQGSSPEGGCYLAAVHPRTVSIWQVTGAAPRLAFKQVRKINVEALPQGCLWNPRRCDLICLLSRQQVSFFFHHSLKERGHVSFPKLETGRICCGCWSVDGTRLVACVGTVLLIYTWPSIDAKVRDCVQAAWKIPSVSPAANISSVVTASGDFFVCALTPSLEALCKNNNTDGFVIPAHSDDAGIIQAQETSSIRDSLFNLQPNPALAHTQEAATTLILLQVTDDKDPVVVAMTRVPELFSPDILHFQMESKCVVVGSNLQNLLLIFAWLDDHLLQAGNITLEKNQRVKGACEPDSSLINTCYGILVLTGCTEPADATFPSLENTAEYSLSLKFFPTRPEKVRQNVNGLGASLRAPTVIKSESLRESNRPKTSNDIAFVHTRQASYKGERPDHRLRSPERQDVETAAFRLPPVMGLSLGEGHPKLVEEVMSGSPRDMADGAGPGDQLLETERVDFSESTAQFTNSRLSQQYELNKNKLTENTNEATTTGLNSDRNGHLVSGLVTRDLGAFSAGQLVQSVLLDSVAARGDNQTRRPVTLEGVGSIELQASRPKIGHQSETSHDHSITAWADGSVRPKYSQHSDTGDSATSTTTTPLSSRSFETRRPSRDSVSSSLSSGQSTSGWEKPEKPARTFQTAADVPVDKFRPSADSSSLGSSIEGLPVAADHSPGTGSSVLGRKKSRMDDGSSLCSSLGSVDGNYDALERQIEIQKEQIEALRKKLGELSGMVEDTACVFPARYQNQSEPEFVDMECIVKQGVRNFHRRFLLDNGRLQLETIKQAFGLLTVELILDGQPIVLGTNVDGYIPMKFTHGSTLQITGIPITALAAALSPQVLQKAFPQEAVLNPP